MITWRKSSHSDETGGQCVEVAALFDAIAIRDSKAPESGHLTLPPKTFVHLLTQLRRKESR
ncbi:DUF397 domain-containing protein [Actinomadura sp. GC306]|uniref:DUF397 domain-containing protein n=1 Tax=Actinomadura sp. GC306 TaxID=2530367 RepID=UPI00104A7EB5|nr:DUF397 domain-containing protein [Actinomadura sp. GC306]TDC67840.1 DUF397 domain-containing protein [Actinomadura sp. GC306]